MVTVEYKIWVLAILVVLTTTSYPQELLDLRSNGDIMPWFHMISVLVIIVSTKRLEQTSLASLFAAALTVKCPEIASNQNSFIPK